MPNDRIDIGKVTGVNAAKRSVRIAVHAAQSHQLNQLEWIYVTSKGGQPLRCKVDDVRLNESGATITLAAGVSRDNVAKMTKATVSIEKTDAAPRPEGYFETEELIGMTLRDESGADIGTVIAAVDTPAHPVIDVETPEGTTFSMPAIPESVIEVDLDADVITVGDLTPFRVDHAH